MLLNPPPLDLKSFDENTSLKSNEEQTKSMRLSKSVFRSNHKTMSKDASAARVRKDVFKQTHNSMLTSNAMALDFVMNAESQSQLKYDD